MVEVTPSTRFLVVISVISKTPGLLEEPSFSVLPMLFVSES